MYFNQQPCPSHCVGQQVVVCWQARVYAACTPTTATEMMAERELGRQMRHVPGLCQYEPASAYPSGLQNQDPSTQPCRCDVRPPTFASAAMAGSQVPLHLS